jgi:hypothetical protein
MNTTTTTTTTTTTDEKSEAYDERTMQVGGGAINEKKRTFGALPTPTNMPPRSKSNSYKATSNRAHLMHAIEGLDRYPNYLSRWSLEDTEELERALEQTLERVRSQKNQVVERRRDMQRLVDQIRSKHPEWNEFLKAPTSWDDVRNSILDSNANKAVFRSGMFRSHNATIPSVEDVLSGQTTVELNAGYLEEMMEEESYDVYSFPIFAPGFCKKLHSASYGRNGGRHDIRAFESGYDSRFGQFGIGLVERPLAALGGSTHFPSFVQGNGHSRRFGLATGLCGGVLAFSNAFQAASTTRRAYR